MAFAWLSSPVPGIQTSMKSPKYRNHKIEGPALFTKVTQFGARTAFPARGVSTISRFVADNRGKVLANNALKAACGQGASSLTRFPTPQLWVILPCRIGDGGK